MLVKLSIVGPVALTVLPALGVSEVIPDKYSSWGVVSILAWFLFYTVKFWIPAIEARKIEAMAEQRREFLSALSANQEQFLETLKTMRVSAVRDRKATRRILRDVVATEKDQMEVILRLSQMMERVMKALPHPEDQDRGSNEDRH